MLILLRPIKYTFKGQLVEFGNPFSHFIYLNSSESCKNCFELRYPYITKDTLDFLHPALKNQLQLNLIEWLKCISFKYNKSEANENSQKCRWKVKKFSRININIPTWFSCREENTKKKKQFESLRAKRGCLHWAIRSEVSFFTILEISFFLLSIIYSILLTFPIQLACSEKRTEKYTHFFHFLQRLELWINLFVWQR